MTSDRSAFPDDKTAGQRRRKLSDKEIKDLELAGGVEGGMEAGSGGPRQQDGHRTRGKDKGGASGSDEKPA